MGPSQKYKSPASEIIRTRPTQSKRLRRALPWLYNEPLASQREVNSLSLHLFEACQELHQCSKMVHILGSGSTLSVKRTFWHCYHYPWSALLKLNFSSVSLKLPSNH